MKSFYELVPKQLGCEVVGINLQTEDRPEVFEQLKKDIATHRFLLFTNQGQICGEKQVEISRWFGDTKSTFTVHPQTPHPDVYRISNDANEGCVGIGVAGWHIDGSFHAKPYAYSFYHMPSVPKKGATRFIPLTEIVERLEPEKKARWDRLWMNHQNERDTGRVNPLLYRHPITRKPILCVHTGKTAKFTWDFNTSQQRDTEPEECKRIAKEIKDEIEIKNKDLIYTHEWKFGEFIITDNLALAHEATWDTQKPVSEVGLRILHRTTAQGVFNAEK